MLQPARRRLPANVLNLPCLRVAVVVGVAFGRVVVVPGFGGPARVDVRIEGPVRQVDALDCVRQRAAFQCVGRQPKLAIPAAYAVARLVFAHLERKHAFRPKRILGLLIRDQLCGAAEFTALRLAVRIEHRNGLQLWHLT